MQTVEAVKKRCCRFGAEVDEPKLILRETVETLDRLCRTKLQEYFG